MIIKIILVKKCKLLHNLNRFFKYVFFFNSMMLVYLLTSFLHIAEVTMHFETHTVGVGMGFSCLFIALEWS